MSGAGATGGPKSGHSRITAGPQWVSRRADAGVWGSGTGPFAASRKRLRREESPGTCAALQDLSPQSMADSRKRATDRRNWGEMGDRRFAFGGGIYRAHALGKARRPN